MEFCMCACVCSLRIDTRLALIVSFPFCGVQFHWIHRPVFWFIHLSGTLCTVLFYFPKHFVSYYTSNVHRISRRVISEYNPCLFISLISLISLVRIRGWSQSLQVGNHYRSNNVSSNRSESDHQTYLSVNYIFTCSQKRKRKGIQYYSKFAS